MSAESTGSDILDQYRNTSNKLKKRFLRKPNLTEASESYSALARRCEDDDLPAYAGLSYVAAARCDGSLGDTAAEARNLTRAGRQFLRAEVAASRLGGPSLYREGLEAAVGCFGYAPGARGRDFEVCESLDRLGLPELKELYLRDAEAASEGSLDGKVFCLKWAARNHVENGDFTRALECFTELSDLVEKAPGNGARAALLLDAEVFRVFLLLILRPSPRKLSPDLARLLERYTWGDQGKSSRMSRDLFILLQSLVLTCQSSDASALPDLESQLWGYLDVRQRDLLRVLVRVYCD